MINNWLISTTFVLFAVASTVATGQGSCFPEPLFSGNVALPMPGVVYGNSYIPLDAYSSALAQFDGDGHVDLICGSGHGSLMYFRGGADWWDFNPPIVINLPFATPPQGGTHQITALAVADFNEDGIKDLLVGDNHSFSPPIPQVPRIHLMLGNGNGTFQSGTPCGPSTAGTTKLCVADFNGDGNLDAGYRTEGQSNADTVGIIWGDGSGSFPTFTQLLASSPNAIGPGWIEAADIDLDADIDAVAYTDNSSPRVILRNLGGGTFATEAIATAGPGLNFGHAFGFLNGDAWPDMVLASTTPTPSPLGDEAVYVRLNDGTGHYPTLVRYPVTALPNQTGTGSEPLLADLDGDNRDEVVIMRKNSCFATNSGDQILVFHNNGSGLLQEPPLLYHKDAVGAVMSVGSVSGVRLLAADLNDDANVDIVTSTRFATTLLLNDGDGGFLTPHGTAMGSAIPSTECGMWSPTFYKGIASGDLNNDGRFDLVALRESNSTADPFLVECTVMLQNAQGKLRLCIRLRSPEHNLKRLALADFDRDGNGDIVVSTGSTGPWPGGTSAVRIAIGNGDGTFDPWVNYPIPFPFEIRAGDLNGDLWPDLVVSNNEINVFLNNGNGTFGRTTEYEGSGSTFFDLADLNGDDALDIAFLTGGVSQLRALFNNGNGLFVLGPESTNLNAIGSEVVCADVNTDGHPDVLVSLSWTAAQGYPELPGGVAVALNDGDGTFTSLPPLHSGNDYRYPTLADLDADGNPDLITIAPPATGMPYQAHMGIVINLGNGDGTFQPSPISYVGSGGSTAVHRPIVVDFDNDGRLDIGVPMGCSPDSDSATHVGFSILLNRMCPAPDPCPADIDNSGSVNIDDLLAVITTWGPCSPPPPAPCPSDIFPPPNGNGIVNIDDLLAVISNWGPCE